MKRFFIFLGCTLCLSNAALADELNDLVSHQTSGRLVMVRNNATNHNRLPDNTSSLPRQQANNRRQTLVLNKTGATSQQDSLTQDEIDTFIRNLPDHDSHGGFIAAEQQNQLDDLVNRLVLDNPSSRSYPSQTPNFRQGHGQSAFLRPVNYRINSPYGYRRHPILGDVRMHTGVDFAAPLGTPIRSAMDGQVIFAGSKGGYGQTVIVRHNQQYSTLYGHASRILVKAGDYVRQGDTVALVGATGRATGPHLHFEIFEYGQRINPASKI